MNYILIVQTSSTLEKAIQLSFFQFSLLASGFSLTRSCYDLNSPVTNTNQDFKLRNTEFFGTSNTMLIIQAGSKMPKQIPANSPTEIRFEMDCLRGFRKIIIIHYPLDS